MSTAGGGDRPQGDEFDGATAAFRRLLKEVAGDERARVDALVVLSQRTVYVATWPTDPESGIRTLTSSTGDTAMPLFSTLESLKDAALRFGWTNPDGSLSWRELGAREALRKALARGVHFVVIDIGSEHSVEFARGEIEPLIAVTGRKDSTGPFAVTGKASSTLMDAVRKSSRPPAGQHSSAPPAGAAEALPPQGALRAAPVPKTSTPFPPERYVSTPPPRPEAANTASARKPSAPPPGRPRKPAAAPDPSRLTGPLLDAAGMTFAAPKPPPADRVLDAVSDALRRFPEVEWATAAEANKDQRKETVIVLRVDPAFRSRVNDLNRAVRLAAEDAGQPLGAVLVDEPAQVRSARSVGLAFFPWKKKAKGA